MHEHTVWELIRVSSERGAETKSVNAGNIAPAAADPAGRMRSAGDASKANKYLRASYAGMVNGCQDL